MPAVNENIIHVVLCGIIEIIRSAFRSLYMQKSGSTTLTQLVLFHFLIHAHSANIHYLQLTGK